MTSHLLTQEVPRETFNLPVGHPSLLMKLCRGESKIDGAKGQERSGVGAKLQVYGKLLNLKRRLASSKTLQV